MPVKTHVNIFIVLCDFGNSNEFISNGAVYCNFICNFVCYLIIKDNLGLEFGVTNTVVV